MMKKLRLPDAARHPILIYIVKCVAGVSIGYALQVALPPTSPLFLGQCGLVFNEG